MPNLQILMQGSTVVRPSTSFNDLSTLFPGTAATEEANAPAAEPAKLEEGNLADTKKRVAAGAPAESTTAKRQDSTVAPKSKVNATAGQKYTASGKKESSKNGNQENKDSPNPLTTANPPLQAASGQAVLQKKPVVKTAADGAPTPAIVSPRVQPKLTETDAMSTDPAPPALSAPPTEADFKSVAQAAVSNLILNVGNSGKPDVPSSGTNGDPPMHIDTST
jgi:hypothetical protein